ncbi:TerD family protein [Streptomyces mirabilis]|uniref:TerD family protein n=1 Tax=Streptomyces mirabilis TaxID=68239 RepID=UPI003689B012
MTGVQRPPVAGTRRTPQRLGFVAYGRWTRRAVESTPWREPEDALRFLDIGQDLACSVTTTASGNFSSTLKPLDTTRVPGLEDLLDGAQDAPESGEPSLTDLDIALGANTPSGSPARADGPYRIRSFIEWKQRTPSPSRPTPVAPPTVSAVLVPGQTLVLPEEARQGLHVSFSFAGADADLTLFLVGNDGRVSADEDFVFYNQPSAADGGARLLGKQQEGPHTVERATIHLSALPDRVQRIAIAINMDVETGLTCGSLTHATLDLDCAGGTAWTFKPPADPSIRAMVIAELYQHRAEGHPVWKLRALSQGWADGLDGLARAHGVNVE